jgi:spore coat protein U-like protein
MAASFNVTGTNRMAINVSAPDVTLVNQSDSAQTLTLVLDSPGQLTLPNSGNQGVAFNVGGSITLDSTTVSGTYQGTINVTVNYQ